MKFWRNGGPGFGQRLLHAVFLSLGLTLGISQWAHSAPVIDQQGVQTVLLQSSALERPISALYLSPPTPKATLIFLTSDAGPLGVEADGSIKHDDDFLIREPQLWLRKGYSVLIPNMENPHLGASKRVSFLREMMDRWINEAKVRHEQPVFLVGNSEGAVTAVNIAGHAPAGQLYGLILTAPVTVRDKHQDTITDEGIANVRVPTFFVVNRRDECQLTPPDHVSMIADSMSRASSISVAYVSGGKTQSQDPCNPRTSHGFYGIETRPVGLIDHWVDAQLH